MRIKKMGDPKAKWAPTFVGRLENTNLPFSFYLKSLLLPRNRLRTSLSNS